MLKVVLIGVFPETLLPYFKHGVMGRAQREGKLCIETCSLLDFSHGKHRKIDDTPYGGGPGLVLRFDVVLHALESISTKLSNPYVILLEAAGQSFAHDEALRLAEMNRPLVFICGRYEGIDARIEHYIDASYSIGPYVLSGGELAAGVIVDAITRLRPGCLGNAKSLAEESHQDNRLEYRQYTKPLEYRSLSVPSVLISGDHAKIAEARKKDANARDAKRQGNCESDSPLKSLRS